MGLTADQLKKVSPLSQLFRCAGQNSIIVVQVGGDEGMDEGLSHRFRKGGPESRDVFEMIKS